MATSNSHSHLLYVSLLYLFLFFSLENNAFAFQPRKVSHQFVHTIEVSNLLPSTTCKHFSNVAKNSATLKVIHRHGPCIQPQDPQKSTNSPNVLKNILLEDQVRVKSIHSRFSKTSAGDVEETQATTLPANKGSTYNTGNYVVKIALGTPKKELPVVFDTGSDLTWSKCKPAVDVLDPTKSTSYSNVSCSSPFCSSASGAVSAARCSSTNCQYAVQYGDNSVTIGFLGQETLTLGSTDTFEKFYFGCSQNSQGLFGNVAGLLGLGRNKISVVSQTAAKYNKLFSYCLPAQSSSTGFLSFGSSQSKSAKFIPLKTTSSDFYDLELTGITVGGQKLAIPTSVFSSSGTIIDSGTVITRLPPAAYSALKSTFRQMMSQYPAAKPFSLLDTCFDFSKTTTVNFPKIVLSFNGATDVEIDKNGVFVGTGPNQLCLAFAGNSETGDTAIIGNTQQKSLEVIYDIGGGRVGFASGGCS